MAADANGNDLGKVDVVITAAAAIAPYDAANVLTSEQGGGQSAQLPEAYVPLGLIKSDGGATEEMDQDDPIEFLQQGYSLSADPTMTIQIGLAEFNAAVRKLITGKTPDEHGMIGIETYTPDTKWLLFYEEVYKNGRVIRKNGVIQVTTTEIDQSERGSVKGRNVTMTWQPDQLIGNGTTTKFNEWHYPVDDEPIESVTASKETITGNAGGSDSFTVEILPSGTDTPITAKSNDDSIAKATVSGSTVNVELVAQGSATITVAAGGRTDTVQVTVNPAE